MSVAVSSQWWRLPGCDDTCYPSNHNPHAHEAWGRRQEIERPSESIVRTGPLVIDLRARTATVDGAEIALTLNEWEILAYLARHPGELCLADDIVGAVWGADVLSLPKYRNGLGRWLRAPLQLLNVNLARMRPKLGTAAGLIETIPGRGRRLRMETPA